MKTDLAVKIAAELCRRFEGFYSSPYICPAGVPTIGYGATYYQNGQAVMLTDAPITRQQAEALLIWMIEAKYLPAVLKLCPGIDSAERLAAIIDFTFNLGSGNLRSSNLRKRINAGQWELVPAELMKWVKGGGKTLPGLIKRRSSESALI